MKVLVTATALDLDRTSEGICSSKFLYCLLRAGIDLLCLAPADSISPQALRRHGSWLKQVRFFSVDQLATTTSRARGRSPHCSPTLPHRLGEWLRDKVASRVVYRTGFSRETWHRVDCWRESLVRAIASERPDLVFVRASGCDFEPHLAMARLEGTPPWIAHYHDPFPLSLYPEPYRRHYLLASAMQERRNATILRKADRISFPCQRLLQWLLRGRLEPYRHKGVVIPHIVGEIPTTIESEPGPTIVIDKRHFTLIHAGSLLRPREPWGLIEAFRRFSEGNTSRAREVELLFVGRVNQSHKADPRWAEASRVPGVRFFEDRVSYDQSLSLLRDCSVAVILEAENEESPFFPAKLTDYLLQRKPILALSPEKSAINDLLGPNYPYRCAPCDGRRIGECIEQLWGLWRTGKLIQALPSEASFSQLTLNSVARNCTDLFAAIGNQRQAFHQIRG